MNISLNRQQQAAVTAPDGPLMIIAGAGTGKTSTLIRRLLYLVREKGVPPSRVLAITFTVRAAREMRERLHALAGGDAALDAIRIGTIHALCHEMLRETGALDGRTVITQADRTALIKALLKDPSFPTPGLTVKEFDRLITIEKSAALPLEQRSPACRSYQQALEERGLLDFDDLVLGALQLFASDAEAAKTMQRRFTHICVDEYQDVNRAQYLLLRCLCPEGVGLCVVGDADQAIYAFRGTQVENFLSFQRDVPGATVVRLTENYRSTAVILNAACALIRNNRARIAGELEPMRQPGHPIEVWELPDDAAEAAFIARETERLLGGVRFETLSAHDDLPAFGPQDIAVLYRLHQQSGPLKKALRQRGIPVRVAKSRSFYDEPRVAAALRMLELVRNPDSDAALEGLLTEGLFAIGKKSMDALRDAHRHNTPALRDVLQTARITAAARDRCAALLHAVTQLRERAASQTIEAITRDVWRTLYPEPASPDDTLLELLTCVMPYAHVAASQGVPQFLDKVALMQESDADDLGATDAVTLLTVHAAKGLEFPVVFLTGLEEGLFPYMPESEAGDEHREEERRLFYVGMTRARDRLYLTAARSRFLFGTRRDMSVSSFLSEIPEQYLLKKDLLKTHKKEKGRQMKLFTKI